MKLTSLIFAIVALLFCNCQVLAEVIQVPGVIMDLTSEGNPVHYIKSIQTTIENIDDAELFAFKNQLIANNASIEGTIYEVMYSGAELDSNMKLALYTNLTITRPFGERIEECQDYIDTVRFYQENYGAPEVIRADDESKSSDGFFWYIEEKDVTFAIRYIHGDIFESVFPAIEIAVAKGKKF